MGVHTQGGGESGFFDEDPEILIAVDQDDDVVELAVQHPEQALTDPPTTSTAASALNFFSFLFIFFFRLQSNGFLWWLNDRVSAELLLLSC